MPFKQKHRSHASCQRSEISTPRKLEKGMTTNMNFENGQVTETIEVNFA